MENCFFYISRMYEFLHRLGQLRRINALATLAACPLCLQQRPNFVLATNRRDVPFASHRNAANSPFIPSLRPPAAGTIPVLHLEISSHSRPASPLKYEGSVRGRCFARWFAHWTFLDFVFGKGRRSAGKSVNAAKAQSMMHLSKSLGTDGSFPQTSVRITSYVASLVSKRQFSSSAPNGVSRSSLMRRRAASGTQSAIWPLRAFVVITGTCFVFGDTERGDHRLAGLSASQESAYHAAWARKATTLASRVATNERTCSAHNARAVRFSVI
jgi:hypothetical protein